MRRAALLTFFAASSAFAQLPAPADTPREPLDPRKNQKIEHLVAEDESTRIDEVRVGGQTERTVVQPKQSSLPAYEIEADHQLRSPGTATREGLSDTGRKRVWNVLSF